MEVWAKSYGIALVISGVTGLTEIYVFLEKTFQNTALLVHPTYAGLFRVIYI